MAREMALQMLYQSDLGGATAPQVCQAFDRAPYLSDGDWDRDEEPGAPEVPRPRASEDGERRKREVGDAFVYARALVEGAIGHRAEIDALISEQADNWRLERMPAVDRNILRLAVYELLYEEDIPKLVIVDEAIELAKRFSTDQSSRFVNGLLDGLLKHHRFPGTMK
jgi:N utilization substance protein B